MTTTKTTGPRAGFLCALFGCMALMFLMPLVVVALTDATVFALLETLNTTVPAVVCLLMALLWPWFVRWHGGQVRKAVSRASLIFLVALYAGGWASQTLAAPKGPAAVVVAPALPGVAIRYRLEAPPSDGELDAIEGISQTLFGPSPARFWATWRPTLSKLTSLEVVTLGRHSSGGAGGQSHTLGVRATGLFDATAVIEAEAARRGVNVRTNGSVASVGLDGGLCLTATQPHVLTIGPRGVDVEDGVLWVVDRLSARHEGANVVGKMPEALATKLLGVPFEAGLWLGEAPRATVVLRPRPGHEAALEAKVAGLRGYLDEEIEAPPAPFVDDAQGSLRQLGRITHVGKADGGLSVTCALTLSKDAVRLNVMAGLLGFVRAALLPSPDVGPE